jgi:hypothetical protein
LKRQKVIMEDSPALGYRTAGETKVCADLALSMAETAAAECRLEDAISYIELAYLIFDIIVSGPQAGAAASAPKTN